MRAMMTTLPVIAEADRRMVTSLLNYQSLEDLATAAVAGSILVLALVLQ